MASGMHRMALCPGPSGMARCRSNLILIGRLCGEGLAGTVEPHHRRWSGSPLALESVCHAACLSGKKTRRNHPMDRFRHRDSFLLAAFLLLSAAALSAQAVPAIRLTVDASQAPLKILRTHLEMPVTPGPLTLYYPKWIPGMHEPGGPIANVTGLKFTANGATI